MTQYEWIRKMNDTKYRISHKLIESLWIIIIYKGVNELNNVYNKNLFNYFDDWNPNGLSYYTYFFLIEPILTFTV